MENHLVVGIVPETVAVTWIPSLGNPPTTRLALFPTRLLLPSGHFRAAHITSVTLSDSHQ